MAHVQPAPVENPLLRLVETALVLVQKARRVRTEKLPRLVARNPANSVPGQPVSGVDPPILLRIAHGFKQPRNHHMFGQRRLETRAHRPRVRVTLKFVLKDNSLYPENAIQIACSARVVQLSLDARTGDTSRLAGRRAANPGDRSPFAN